MPAFLNKFGRKKLIIGLLVLTVLATAGWFLFPKQKKDVTQIVTVKKGGVESTVSASGNLSGKDTANLRFKISGKLSYINVKTGDRVTKGQVIAGLDTQDLSITLQQAYNTLRSKQATADKILDDVKDHKSDESYTQRQTRTTAEADRDNAYDAVKAAQRAFQDSTLTSPIEGVIIQEGPVAGQVISAADVIVQVSNADEIYFDADVDEADIGKVLLSQQAKVTLDAYPEKEFIGTVSEIMSQTQTSSSGATTITVRIGLNKTEFRFVSGLNGQATIIYDKALNVLIIPQEALRDNNTVIVKIGNRYKSVKVEPGIKSDVDVEIRSGLNERDQVVTNPDTVKGV